MPARNHMIASLVGAILFLIPGGQARGQEFVTTNGRSFQVCDRTLRFVGFNLRGICHYGRGDVLPYAQSSHIATNLDYCAAAKSTVIRTFCAYNGIGRVETGNRLEAILDACQARGIYVIIALTDMYWDSQMHPQGDQAYYTVHSGWVMLNHNFFAGGYTQNYLPQAVYLADRFKNHPAVFAWQLGNEIRDLSSGSTFVTFCQNAAAQIRTADPNHLISVGLMGWRESNISYSQALQIYGAMDFVSAHSYHGSDYNNDSDVANQLNMPFVIGEAAFAYDTYGPDRTPMTNADIAKWLSRGADGYLQWGLMATAYDNGDGDRYVGVDLAFHASDFWAYRSLFNTWGSSFETPPTLEVEPASFERTIAFGGNPSDDVFAVRNAGTGSLSFTVNESVSWLSVQPAAGQAGCQGTELTIRYDTSSLAFGTHVGLIEVAADGAAGSPQYVEVTVTVEGMPGDFNGDGDVDQEDFGQMQACLTTGGIPISGPECTPADFDNNRFVNQIDMSLFIGCMTQPNELADPDCLN